jgi:selenocysteine lyase/cysteine desulfurase
MVYHVHSWLDAQKVTQYEERMSQRLLRALMAHERIHVLGRGDADEKTNNSVGIVSFNILYGNGNAEGCGLYLHYNFVCALLNDLFGVQARGGCACAGGYML